MDSLIVYFLPTILALGIVTSYEDIKEGKIRNKYTFTAIALSIAINAILALSGIINLEYILTFAAYLLISAVMAILLWHYGMWSAGDAKLYTAFISLLPLTTYNHSASGIPIFDMLVNVITPLAAYLGIIAAFKTSNAQKLSSLKKAASIKNILSTLLIIFSIGWIAQMILGYFQINSNYIYNVIIIIVIVKALQKIWENQLIPLLAAIAIIRAFVQQGYVLRAQFLASFIITTAIYVIVSSTISGLGDTFTATKRYNLLKKGDKLSMTEVIRLKEKGLKISSTGLDTYSIKTIKKLCLQGKIRHKNFEVYQTIPFAPFLFLGCLATIIAQGNLFISIKTLL